MVKGERQQSANETFSSTIVQLFFIFSCDTHGAVTVILESIYRSQRKKGQDSGGPQQQRRNSISKPVCTEATEALN